MESESKDTIVHRIDVQIKFMLLLACAIFVTLIDSIATLYILFCVMIVLHVLAKNSLFQWKVFMSLILLTIWSCMVTQSVFYNQEPRTALFCLISKEIPVIGQATGGIYLYKEGLQYGALQALRMCVMAAAGLLLTWTSDTKKIFQCMKNWNVPIEISFMVMTALRFFTVVIREAKITIQAQQLRQHKGNKSVLYVVYDMRRILLPLLARSLRRAKLLAISAECRGLGRERLQVETRVNSGKMWPGVVLLCLVMLLAAIKFIYVLQQQGIAYFSSFRDIYDFARLWL